ncbi:MULTISPECIES: multidrug effflux MFS transporter [Pseudomonas]|jgi:DHA1 family bicyclomycin/chloramphenicol resistance-like MFS transporter|uniref:Bcr/CflA family efflux transporter n=2 Tax=Pseudomonas chlororaphis TaxID=587753 RepID=A0AAP9VVX4_9PSED|nr:MULTISPECIES: multidrug effflux MFS transporter [Pseudomonas]AIS15154.1 major facilitator transporter [Pseudomonas chlororaphis subsp. aurantiaca]AUG38974.1 Bcr/CflA family drug resistance efflux transporter [Pseudomonas chlororaphis]AZD64642.1 Multidrug resistance transporter, Bcr/CflA family [Pseudomonas chlororaphis subsp. aurantiaca]AZD71114.1 Multidrug resistance transporter, Bcr/CflA family [Pseudomonas chlororaphis subsp. aurantiaca]AZD77317.1 Multidrug resistance transporter, Bcr/Cf
MNLRTILILGALSAFGPLAIDFYLPAFPAMALAFGTDEKHVQLTLAAYFLGLSIGQLAYGPVADRFGRRIPLLAGVGLFTLASLACAYAPNLEWLIGARFVQALGGCAGMVISRAVVSDKCDAVGSAKVFSQLMLVMGLAPILAPMLGGLLVNLYGWQSIFIMLTLFSALAGLAVALGLPESLPAHVPRQPLSGALRQYGRLLADRVFLGHALTGGIAIAGMFAYIAGSPFVFIKLYGVPAEHFGWFFGINAGGFILVAQINARLLAKRGPAFLLARTVWIYLLGGLALLAVSSLHPAQLWPLLLPLFICIASLGCILPNASACAMNGQGARAGSASAMLGCLQFSVAAGAAALVGVLHDGSAVPMATVISLCGILVVTLAMVTRKLQNARALQAAQL